MSIGKLIKVLRDGRGWSQGDLAVHLCNVSGRPTLTREEVSRWEAGKRSPGRFWLRFMAELFSVPLEALQAAKAGHPSALAEAARQGIMEAMGEVVSMDDWRRLADDYGRDFMALSARRVEPRLAGGLLLLRGKLSDDRPCLWEAAARLSIVMGMATASLDGPAASARWYRTAVAAADRSGRTSLREWTRGQGALALVYEGAEPEPVISVAVDGLALSESPSLGRLCALLALAHGYGKLGEPGLALDALRGADEMFPAVETDEQASVFSMPRWGYSLTKTLVHARLGDVERSQAEQDTADLYRPAHLSRYAAHTGVHRALSVVKSGDVNTGLDLARETLADLPEDHRSTVLQGFVSEVKAAARAT
ncbi:helix-turn-helix transcriptional regulator [Streptomyces sp. NPDC045470]|uniref:helix-turn-helix transcriptional regulator n=1 Tax=Streptomyces sp. NPDC045470 TaxID=3155469 RepID=UPI0033DA698C